MSLLIDVVPFVRESKEEWARFVDTCPEAWLHHRPEFVEMTVDNKTCVDWSFSLRFGGNIVGVCVLRRDSAGMGRVLSGPGLALSPATNRKDVLLAAEKEIRRLAATGNCQGVRFHLSPLAPGLVGKRYHASLLADLAFSFGPREDNLDYVVWYVNMIDLHRDMNVIHKGFSKRNYSHVTRCAKIPLSTNIVTKCPVNDLQWSGYLDLHRLTFERNSLRPFDEARQERLRRAVTEGYMALVNAYEGTDCIASILLETYKNGAAYSVGACNARALKIGAMVFIHYSAMRWAKDNNFKWYYMGTSSPQCRVGYDEFKRRFGGEQFDFLSGELILDRKAYLRKILLPTILEAGGLIPPVVRKVARAGRRILSC